MNESPRKPSPQFFMADNDYALGLLVEAVSNSPYWKDTAICVVEDDAQDGPDHVDAHRSVLLVISAYNRPGALIHEFHTTVSLIRTMELLLGIAPMNQLDALAPLMTECFTSVPNFDPYIALTNNVRLDEMNPGTASLSRKQSYWVKQSLKLNFKQPDRADENTLNRIVWHSVKGVDARYPARFAGAHGKGLKKLKLVLTGQDDEDDD